jgi:ABC-type uncharacterized transport system involved in gliding motility auxiliary subunit
VTNQALLAIAWAGTVLVALAVGRFAALDPAWDTYLRWVAVAGLACAAIYGVMSRRERHAGFVPVTEHRRLFMPVVAAVMAFAVLLNIVAARYAGRWDVTADQMFALAPETRAALRSLEAPMRVRLFAPAEEAGAYRDRLQEYAEASPRVAIEYVDVEAEPTLAAYYGIESYGTAVVEYDGRVELVAASSEQEFANAVIRLREGRTRKVYFTIGHAERDTASTERVGYSGIAAALTRENFLVETINFTERSDVPADATLVVVAGPRADFLRVELDGLRRFLEKGGGVLFLVDPFEDLKRYITESGLALFMMDPESVSATGELRNLTAFLRSQGAEIGNDVVVDQSQMGQFIGTDASVPVAARYPAHPVTETLSSLSAYPMARSVSPAPASGRTVSPIIETSEQTWAETDIRQLGAGRLSLDADQGDRPGPITLGLAVSSPASPAAGAAPGREARIAVIGDSDFVANYSGNIPGNSQVFMSIVHWLAQERVVTIPPKEAQERALAITSSQERALTWLALLLIPGVVFGAAWYLRSRGNGADGGNRING